MTSEVREFIKDWNSAKSVAQVARKWGMSKASASTKAARARAEGAKVKKFAKHTKKGGR